MFRLSHIAVLFAFALTASGDEISFRNDVLPILSKAGCNLGACHGGANGKNGFKLSLREENPAADHLALSTDISGRRVNRAAPDQSLLLLKATAQVPHEGRERFKIDSREYRVMRDWIASGLKDDTSKATKLTRLTVTPNEKILVGKGEAVRLKVEATFANGIRRDVSDLAVYEPVTTLVNVSADGVAQANGDGETVVLVRFIDRQMPVRLAFIPDRARVWSQREKPLNYIDRHVFDKLQRLRLQPAVKCSDEVFIRRVSLDLLGIVPTPEEAMAFIADKLPDKRSKLVERLLLRPEFADYWALKWADLFKTERRALDERGLKFFYDWLRESVAQNRPLNEFARELLASRGSTYTNAPSNFYRAHRTPVLRAEAAAQVFLGLRLQCAQCHNHPYDRWSQDDYHNWAAVFAQVNYKIIENKRTDKNDQQEFVGEQIVLINDKGEHLNPRIRSAATPRLLGVAEAKGRLTGDSLRAAADWVADPANPLFARAQANRIWFHLMGRGLVDPVDDLRPTNPPSHPELLDELTADLVKNRFDLRHLIRQITASHTYQSAAESSLASTSDAVHYAYCLPRSLAAEQLLDSLSRVIGVPIEMNGLRAGQRVVQLAGPVSDRKKDDAEKFLTVFGKPPRLMNSECERLCDPTLGQSFQMMSGPVVASMIAHSDNRLGRLLAANKSNAEIVEELSWAALGHAPTAAGRDGFAGHLAASKNRRAALEDILWALVNAKEFVLRN